MIHSALRLSEADLNEIGRSKANSYRSGGKLCVVKEGTTLAIVQGYKVGNSIADCLPTCIQPCDLAGHAKACFID